MGRSFDRHRKLVGLGEDSAFHIPIILSEMLHATLGPLADQLASENHPWAHMAQRVLTEYTERRNQFLQLTHGSAALAAVKHETFLAAEWVCELTTLALDEACDFAAWATEVGDETA